MSTSNVSEYWYALSQVGNVVNKSNQKDTVLSDEAFYYVKTSITSYNTTKWFLFNTSFEPTTLKYNGIVGSDTELTVKAAKQDANRKLLRFYLKDRTGQMLSREFNAEIEGFRNCILFMEELGNYGSLKEMTLSNQNEQLKDQAKIAARTIAELEKRNKELELKLTSIHECKNDLMKLSQLLFNA